MIKWLRAFRLTKKEFIILITMLSILKCILLYWVGEVLVTPHRMIGYLPDSRMYETIARNIISGHGFSSDMQEPFRPTMFKEPVYALFIALIYLIFGYFTNYIILFQMLLNPLIAILIYFIGIELFDERIARWASLLVCFTPVFGEISFFIQTEGFYLPLMLLFLYTMIKAFAKNRLPYYVFSGILLGICSLCRNIIVYSYALIIILIAAGYGQGLRFNISEGFKRRFTKALFFTASFLLVVLPWIVRNIKEFKSYQITNKGGESAWVQATMAENFSTEEFKAYFLYTISGHLAQKKFPHIIGSDFGDFEYRFQRDTPSDGLRAKGLKEGEIDLILAKEAARKIFRHPLKFIIFSTIKYLQIFKYFVPWSILFFDGNNKVLSGLVFPAVRFITGLPLGIFFSLITILGIYFSRERLVKYLPILVFIGYYHFILYFVAALPGGLQRFILPVVPLYYFFVSICIFRGCGYRLH